MIKMFQPGPSIVACIFVMSSSDVNTLIPSGGFDESSCSSLATLLMIWGEKFSTLLDN